MNTTTKMRSAEACALSVRLPRAGQRLLAPTAVGDQGTALFIATPLAMVRNAVVDAGFTGTVRRSTGATFVYTTSDVVRSLPGRLPV